MSTYHRHWRTTAKERDSMLRPSRQRDCIAKPYLQLYTNFCAMQSITARNITGFQRERDVQQTVDLSETQ